MISNQDRSGYFGASDAKFILDTDFNSKTFAEWWDIKTGRSNKHIVNDAMVTGTLYEHPIMQTFSEMYKIPLELDKQIIIEDLKLRVNLDANSGKNIYECKTFKAGKRFNYKQYINQVRIQMYAMNTNEALIVAYPVTDADYAAAKQDFVLPINKSKIEIYPIQQDEKWIKETFLPRLRYLAFCLTEDKYPDEEEYNLINSKLATIPNEKEFNALQTKISALNNQIKALKAQKEELESAVLHYMEESGIKSFSNDVVKITYVAPVVKKNIDTTMLKEKYPEIAKECEVESITKSSLRIKVYE